jgi:glucosamine 6-phosphate synthetase-like amidotransferase/phosphosugar isomerase protein
VIVVASGVDRPAARELVLKVEEGVHLPAAMRDLETLLHGHLAGMDAATGLVLILTDGAQAESRRARAAGVLRAVAELGVTAGAILGAGYDGAMEAGLTPAGRLVVPDAPDLAPVVASLLGSAVPLQLLTERLARARGVNPDPIRRDDPAWLRAAEAAG